MRHTLTLPFSFSPSFLLSTSLFSTPRFPSHILRGKKKKKKSHIRLNRVDRRSQLACLSECRDLLAAGAPVLFFPEGTRSKDGTMAEFKKGAFSVAAKAGVPVVPVSLVGTGALMPNGQEGKLFGGLLGGRVSVVVHDRIPASKDADAMMEAARAAIASSL